MKNLNKFFAPKSIAIVGASPGKEKMGNVLLRNLVESGWKGKIYCVNSKYKRVGKYKCYPGLKTIKKNVDLVLVAIPSAFVGQILKDGAESDPKIENFVVISSGFKETGENGKKLENDLERIAETHKLNILGPNCLGFINPRKKLNATFTSGKFRSGNIAIVSQSGALAVAFLDWIEKTGFGFSKVISIGNKAVLDEADILQYLAGDKSTKAVAIYVEDISSGAKFLQIAQNISARKPVVILKAGKTKTGQQAVSSHTGSLAQDEAVAEAVFEKLNLIEAKNIEEFQDVIYFLNSGGIFAKKDVLIVTNAGGPGVIASDFIGNSKFLKLLKIPDPAKKELRKKLPPSASVRNPVDIIGDATPDRYQFVLEIIAKKMASHPVLVLLTPQTQTEPEKVALLLKKYRKTIPCLSASFLGGKKIEAASQILRSSGIANFGSPQRALLALEKLIGYQKNKTKISPVPGKKEIHLKLKVNSLIQEARKEKRRLLFWDETREVLEKYGIRLADSLSLASIPKKMTQQISFPAVLKTDDSQIVHRWEKKAVKLNIQNEKELRSEFRKMKRGTKSKRFLVQSQMDQGLEMILGLKRDPIFGPVILAGWGGTFTEIFKDRILLIPPFLDQEIKRKLAKLQIFPVLRGFRGKAGYKLAEIMEIAQGISDMAAENPDISQIDINPVILYNDGNRYEIPDAKIFLN